MKTRILTAAIALVLLVGVMLLPSPALYCAFTLICVLAVYETFSVTGLKRHRSMFVFSLLFAAAAPFFGVADSRLLFSASLAIFVLALVLGQLRHHADIPLSETGLAFFYTMILSVGISCTAYCRALNENGLFYFILALIIAWGNDTGAYFAGTFFGKHKLCPSISPKKTVEGLVGGWITSVAAALLLSYIWRRESPRCIGRWRSWRFCCRRCRWWAICLHPPSSGKAAQRTSATSCRVTAASWIVSILWCLSRRFCLHFCTFSPCFGKR